MDRESTGHILFHSFAPLPHCHLQGLPCSHWTPNHGWVPLGVGTPPFHQPTLRGAGPGGLVFTFAPPSLLPSPSDPCGWRVPRWAEDQAQDLSRFLGAQVGRRNLATLPVDLLPSQWFPNFPLQAWDPFPSSSHTSGAPVPSDLHFFYPFTPPTPYLVAGGSSCPLRCSWSPTSAR